MMEFMQQGTTVTSEMYCETLKKLHKASHSEQKRGILTSSVVLLHDNAHPHRGAYTTVLWKYFNWELFDHPLYSMISLRATTICLPT
jgi:hypothetical protein